ncbi:hypothetical protein ACQP00_00390 [Dactylosporangium sp. CS-047395]|uniref:hypothetical protein n=1 Tax=Dactylosporangium sp. CS-047395 TaxID=3239936 RepID=UPI003D8E1E30
MPSALEFSVPEAEVNILTWPLQDPVHRHCMPTGQGESVLASGSQADLSETTMYRNLVTHR